MVSGMEEKAFEVPLCDPVKRELVTYRLRTKAYVGRNCRPGHGNGCLNDAIKASDRQYQSLPQIVAKRSMEHRI